MTAGRSLKLSMRTKEKAERQAKHLFRTYENFNGGKCDEG